MGVRRRTTTRRYGQTYTARGRRAGAGGYSISRRPPLSRIQKGYYRGVGFYGVEKKFLDTDVQGSFLTGNGTIVPSLNIVPQGTNQSERIGRKIYIHNIRLRMTLTNTGTDFNNTDAIVRIILYIDHQANGAAATGDEILDNTIGPNLLDNFRNLAQQERFTVLWDKTWNLNSTSSNNAAAGGLISPTNRQLFTKFSHTFKSPIPIEYSGVNGSLVEQTSNNIGLLYITNGANTKYDVFGISRIRFMDNM